MSDADSSLGEFALIARFFRRGGAPAPGVALGIGDDCALLQLPPGEQLAVSTDMLVVDRHFFADVDPAALGHKALAVNLSDLAACGARPLGCTLSLALPGVDPQWLQGFSDGFLALADSWACPLVGGDTTRGPLTLNVTVMGGTPAGQALLRSGAAPGHDIWVSHDGDGGLGDAWLALQLMRIEREPSGHLPGAWQALASWSPTERSRLLQACRHRLERPQPRVALGLALRGVASACADLSDGLCGDLGHILQASHVGATLWARHPQSDAGLLAATSSWTRALGPEPALQAALTGGDDYELVFTAAPAQRDAVQQAAQRAGVRATRIGQIEAKPGLRWIDLAGRPHDVPARGFDHFA